MKRICEETGKVVLSQSQAQRKTNNYDEIQRYYYCEHCEGFHLTSKEFDPNKSSETPKKKKKLVNPITIQNRINQLKKRI